MDELIKWLETEIATYNARIAPGAWDAGWVSAIEEVLQRLRAAHSAPPAK